LYGTFQNFYFIPQDFQDFVEEATDDQEIEIEAAKLNSNKNGTAVQSLETELVELKSQENKENTNLKEMMSSQDVEIANGK